MRAYLHDPEYWRARAAEARTEASRMTDPRAKKHLLEMADNYEQLAEQQERRGVYPAKQDSD
jgi:hypothetical protein